MAVLKPITNEYGADFKYHRISDVRIINNNGNVQIRIVVDSYLDEESRRQGKAATRTENIIQNADFALTPFYALLKAKFPQFQDADDILESKENRNKQAIMTQQTVNGKLIKQWKEGEL